MWNVLEFLHSETFHRYYWNAVYAGISIGAVGGAIRSIQKKPLETFKSSANSNITFPETIDKPVQTLVELGRVSFDASIEAGVSGLFIAMLPVSLPAYMYTRSRYLSQKNCLNNSSNC